MLSLDSRDLFGDNIHSVIPKEWEESFLRRKTMNKFDEDWERVTKRTTQETSPSADNLKDDKKNTQGKGPIIIVVISVLALLAVFVTVGILIFQKKSPSKGSVTAGKEKYYFRAGEKYLEVYDGKEFTPIFLKGVNLGVGKPWYYPGEFAITKEEYTKWCSSYSFNF